MSMPVIDLDRVGIEVDVMSGFSLEITTKDVPALRAAAAKIPPGTSVSITSLSGDAPDDIIQAAAAVRNLGFEPMPHFAARRFKSHAEFETILRQLCTKAAVQHCFVIAGDMAEPLGPFADSLALIETGAFETSGISTIGVGGHPEGHPNMTPEQCFAVLERKCTEIARRGMAPLITTQFVFAADPLLDWLGALRSRNITAPVRLGLAGPAGIKTLLRFAARCGVGTSASVLAKYGISLTRLFGHAGPDELVAALAQGLRPAHGAVSLHFYPFGGLERTVDWVLAHKAQTNIQT